jgi:hypothetical protein
MAEKNHQTAGKESNREPSHIPATEIAVNPNPRANENISHETENLAKEQKENPETEITDGESG